MSGLKSGRSLCNLRAISQGHERSTMATAGLRLALSANSFIGHDLSDSQADGPVPVNVRSARGNLVGCEQIGHKGQQVRRNLPFESARIAHRLDEADGAALGQDVVVPATVASDGKPAKRLPLRRQISNTNHVQAGPVWTLTKHATRADRSTPAYRQPAPQQR